MFKLFKYHIILIIAICIGSIVLHSLVNNYYDSIEEHTANGLNEVHSAKISKIETGLNIYATVVSSIRSYIESSKSHHPEDYPTDKEIQGFLKGLIREINFKDSIVVSIVDTNHTFKHVITPYELDPHNLEGINITGLRPEFEIQQLNNMMQQDSIVLFNPINLKEGWAALPFNFSIKNHQNKTIGYVAVVLNVRYLLDSFYKNEDNSFVYRFMFGDNIEFNRYAVFDGTKINNTNIDKEYYKFFNKDINDFKYTDLEFFGLKLNIGSAYKVPPEPDNTIAVIAYLWYALLFVVTIVTMIQFLKNYKLNTKLKFANKYIEIKNKELEYSLSKIQTLIKEIHHRVKNNMQMVSSLLLMQQNEYKDEKIIDALEQCRNRIQSISLVHKKLYGSENLENVNLKDYINQLIGYIEDTIGSNSIIPSKTIQIPDDVKLAGEIMMNLGLILNELITNSYKYAFTKNQNNQIIIVIVPKNESLTLKYYDSGPGIPDEIDIKNSKTLGLQLISILTEQLKGTINYNKNVLNEFIIEFQSPINR